MGEGFTWETQDKTRDIAAARKGWEKAKELIRDRAQPDGASRRDQHRAALRLSGPIDEVVAFLKTEKPAMTHVVLTGRNAKEELIEIADLVTEMTWSSIRSGRGSRGRRVWSSEVKAGGAAPGPPRYLSQDESGNGFLTMSSQRDVTVQGEVPLAVQGESAVPPPVRRPEVRRRHSSLNFILPKNTSAGGSRTRRARDGAVRR